MPFMIFLELNAILSCFSQMDNLDPDMKTLFEQVGIQEGADKDTVDFIYDFVEKHGGIDAIKKEISTGPLPPPRGTVI